MPKKLIILSDLWGKERSDWLVNYTRHLEAEFEISYYDCCELGGLDGSEYTEADLHKGFVNGGIERACEALVKLEKERVSILGFSIGGTIAWKYGLISSNIDSLTCVSSTRLRHEVNRTGGDITLYYGGNDGYRPHADWIERMSLKCEIIANKSHQLYMESEFAEHVCRRMLEAIKSDTKPSQGLPCI